MKKPFLLTLAMAAALGYGLFVFGAPGTTDATHDLPCADVDGNKVVGFSDFEILIFYNGQFVPPAPPGADVDGDGTVGLSDFLALLVVFATETNCQDTPAHAQGPFPGLGDDTFPSLGKFRILVAPEFRPLMAGYPGYDGVSRVESPTLSDANTVVGRSAPHLDGDGSDTGGTAVGTAGTIISDSSFSLVPASIEGPAGSREVHTEIVSLNLTGLGAWVRAGTFAPAQPISPGEVEAQSSSGNPVDDFPADSFFNVFAEMFLPAIAGFPGGTLYNTEPLLVVSNKVEGFPPRVIYFHGNTTAVPVFFKNNNPGFWSADDLFGHLILAGHGANIEDSDAGLFEAILEVIEEGQGEIPLPGDEDTDNDGCTDQQENGPNEALGGRRDFQNYWDFYDPSRDREVGFDDFLALLRHYDIMGNPAGFDPKAVEPPLLTYWAAVDRDDTGPFGDPWDEGAADGDTGFNDFLALLRQYGHNCQAAP